ncbi:MAG: hypothetical protein LC772_03735, partial [Chloroflexi bacterium]|nr:hypothetical protein [Chloroflexota bacterium]
MTAEPIERATPGGGGTHLPAAAVRWLMVIILALPLIVLNCYWIANSEMKSGVTEVTISSLFMGVTFILFVITLLNLAIRRLIPTLGLRQGEMLVLYVMLSISSVVAGVGNYGFMLPFLANVSWFADPAKNKWTERFLPLLPKWWGPRDKDAILKPFYEGNSSAFHAEFLRAWAVPLVIWGLFLMVLIWTMLCLAAILRRQWSDHEHLTFPVIYLPVEMTSTSGALYRNRLLWFGFAIPFAFQSLNSLHSIFPTTPSFQINRIQNLSDYVTMRPWNGIDAMPYALHPAGVGLGFLVSLDMLFSTWFFYLLFKALNIFGVAIGWRDPAQGWFGLSEPRFPYWGYQSWGAWITLALMSLVLARPYLAAFFRKAWRRDYDDYDQREALSPRVAVVGFLLGFLALWIFGIWMGMSAWLCFCLLVIYLLIMLTLSRIRAEAAVPSTELVWVTPQNMLTAFIGTSNLSHPNMEGMAIYGWFNTDYRATAMPHEFEAFKAAGMANVRLKPLVVCILIAAAVAIVAATFSDLQLYYVNGAGAAKVNTWRIDKGNEPWNNLSHWWDNPRPTDPAAVLGAILGGLITLGLTMLRTRWMGFPLHPAGYVLNTSFAMEFFWIDFIVAWVCKSFVLRYGGMKAYRSALPF